MLQATYKDDDTYVFYVSTEDRRYNTSVPSTQLRYLFKFTNDMDGGVVYAYGQNQAVYNRYTKVSFSHNTTEDEFLGRVNFTPNGYWQYNVYELATDSTSVITNSCFSLPQISTGLLGTLTIREGNFDTGTIVKQIDFYNGNTVVDQYVDELAFSTYYLNLSNSCGDAITTSLYGLGITTVTAQTNDNAWLVASDATTTSTGLTFKITSYAPIGYSYDFENDNLGGYIETTDITTIPQTTIHSIAWASSNEFWNLGLYDSTGGAAGSGTYVFAFGNRRTFAVPNTTPLYGRPFYTIWNPELKDASGSILVKGNFYFNARYGDTLNSTDPKFYTLEGDVEQGKLYVSEPSGEEQVQYTQNSPASGTNYIWYGQ